MERGKKNSDRRRRAERGSERSGQEDGTTYTSRGDRSTTVSLHTMDGRLTSRFLGFAIFSPQAGLLAFPALPDPRLGAVSLISLFSCRNRKCILD